MPPAVTASTVAASRAHATERAVCSSCVAPASSAESRGLPPPTFRAPKRRSGVQFLDDRRQAGHAPQTRVVLFGRDPDDDRVRGASQSVSEAVFVLRVDELCSQATDSAGRAGSRPAGPDHGGDVLEGVRHAGPGARVPGR